MINDDKKAQNYALCNNNQNMVTIDHDGAVCWAANALKKKEVMTGWDQKLWALALGEKWFWTAVALLVKARESLQIL